ncbi:hypothetical protein D3C77_441340 [compost metagenome]
MTSLSPITSSMFSLGVDSPSRKTLTSEYGELTVAVNVSFKPAYSAVIVDVPAAISVITPLLTVSTSLLDEDHEALAVTSLVSPSVLLISTKAVTFSLLSLVPSLYLPLFKYSKVRAL